MWIRDRFCNSCSGRRSICQECKLCSGKGKNAVRPGGDRFGCIHHGLPGNSQRTGNPGFSSVDGQGRNYAYLWFLSLIHIWNQFDKDICNFSSGQKKKVLIAKSLCEPAHLYIWDEPLNYLDVYARMQIEQLIKAFSPTMIFVEHDRAFRNRCV